MMTLIPPSAMTMAPTMKLDFSDARKATTSAMTGALHALLDAFAAQDAKNKKQQDAASELFLRPASR
jgi:hypothetical protein